MKQKLKKTIIKELVYFFITLVILSVILHSDLLTDPLSRFTLMNETGNYSHPFIYTFFVYGALFILRKSIDFVFGLFEKKE